MDASGHRGRQRINAATRVAVLQAGDDLAPDTLVRDDRAEAVEARWDRERVGSGMQLAGTGRADPSVNAAADRTPGDEQHTAR
jgi:hypothetical protein